MTRTLPPGALEAELTSRLSAIDRNISGRKARSARGRGRARAKFVGILGVISLLLLSVSGVLAVHDLDFELDGNTLPADAAGTGDTDWESLFIDDLLAVAGDGSAHARAILPADYDRATFVEDWQTTVNAKGDTVFDTSDLTTFTTGSKDILDIDQWRCVSANNVTNKGDLTNVFASFYEADGDRVLYFGAEKTEDNGDNNIGLWLLQGDASCQVPASGNGNPWVGNHRPGDILLVSEFTNGGGVSSILAYEWLADADPGTLGDQPGLDTSPFASGADCNAPAAADDPLCATTNVGPSATSPTHTPAWTHYSKRFGINNGLERSTFFEGGINLADFPEFNDTCFSSFLFNTRSSQELTATLYDYAQGVLNTCDANVSIAASGTNEVGTPHTFTITANSLSTVVPVSFELDASVSPTPDSFDESDCATPTISNGGLTATCEVVINDADPGVFTVNATALVHFAGNLTLTRDTDPATVNIGSGPGGSGPATKTYVDAYITIAADDTNEVGDPHTFTVYVAENDGTGWDDAAGETVTITFPSGAPGTYDDSDCTDGTDANGNCFVTVNSNVPGVFDVHAASSVQVGGLSLARATDGTGNNSGDATKTYVDAYITIEPDDTNGITEAHTFTVYVAENDGTGWDDAAGETVTITWPGGSGTPGTVNDTDCTNGTASDGTCLVVINSSVAGTFNAHAASNVQVGGISVFRETDGTASNSDDAVKIYVAGSLTWIKHDNNGQLLGGATFRVCRTHDRFGTDIPDECVDILDDIDNVDDMVGDWDGTPGEFKLGNLLLGTYTIEEITPPAGYTGDAFVDTVVLSLASPDGSASHVWVNTPPSEGCTPGFWKNHESVWDEFSDPVVQAMPAGYEFVTSTSFNAYFGLTAAQSGVPDTYTMLDAANATGGDFGKLARHGVSALLNVISVDYPITDFVGLYNDLKNAFLAQTYEPFATTLAGYNNLDHQSCPTT